MSFAENTKSLKRKAAVQGENPVKRRRISVNDRRDVEGGESVVVIEKEVVNVVVVVEVEEEEEPVARSPSPLTRPPSCPAPLVSSPVRPIERVPSPTLEPYASFYKDDTPCRSLCIGFRAFVEFMEERLKQRNMELDRELEAFVTSLN